MLPRDISFPECVSGHPPCPLAPIALSSYLTSTSKISTLPRFEIANPGAHVLPRSFRGSPFAPSRLACYAPAFRTLQSRLYMAFPPLLPAPASVSIQLDMSTAQYEVNHSCPPKTIPPANNSLAARTICTPAGVWSRAAARNVPSATQSGSRHGSLPAIHARLRFAIL